MAAPAGLMVQDQNLNIHSAATMLDGLMIAKKGDAATLLVLLPLYEKDMLAFSGCTRDLFPEEADELKGIRESAIWWKVKDIHQAEQRERILSFDSKRAWNVP